MLFRWQIEALELIRNILDEGRQIDVLIAASVGGGKTRVGLETACNALARNDAKRIIVVTFTARLVKQWGKKAKRHNLNLLELLGGNGKLDNGLPPDCQGYICTYAALGQAPDIHESFATQVPALIIFDEIHHLADEQEPGRSKWGDAAKSAFRSVAFRLSLSGTPFRSNASRIPFLRYEPLQGSNIDSEVIPDITYSYGDAVTDKICRRVVFEDVDGLVKWTRNGTEIEARFSDQIEERLCGDRLRYGLTANGDDNKTELMRDMLKRANRKLMQLRAAGHQDAGGIIIAIDAAHARALRSLLRKTTGHQAVLVLNDEPGSLEAIDDFDKGTSPWIIAVKMVSEGVDIPRLRVCVYATNVTEELFIIQVMGRIVRRPEDNPLGEGFFYYPADPYIVAVVKKVEDEMNLRLQERARITCEGKEQQDTQIEREHIGTETGPWGATISGEQFAADDVEVADAIRTRYKFDGIDIRELVRFARDVREYERPTSETDTRADDRSYSELHETMRTDIQRAVGQLNYLTSQPHNEIHTALNRFVGVTNKETATLDQLQAMLKHINEQVTVARQNQR